MRSSYKKLKKKLCKDCSKGLASSIINNDEVKNFNFCVNCEPITKKVITLQAELDEETNKNIVKDFNYKKGDINE